MKLKDLLLVIDMQNVYLPEEEWACPGMPDAAKQIQKVLEAKAADTIFFTKFAATDQPKGCWNAYNQEYQTINENVYLNELAEPFKKVEQIYPVYTKSTYSSMRIPEIREAMKQHDRLVLTGVVAECCILATLMEAIDDGIKVVYLTDCIAGQNKENEDMIRRIAESFSPMHVLVMDSQTYISAKCAKA